MLLRLTIGLVTFIIGLSISFVFRSPRPQSLVQPVVTEMRINPQPQEPPEVPKVQAHEGYDLSIGVGVEEMTSRAAIPVKLDSEGAATLELELGASIDGRLLTLNFADRSASYRVLQRYRTSMSISAEGPHLDLMDWRHYDSRWVPLKSIGDRRFRTLRTSEMEYSRFPPTTKAEIVQEVRRRVEKDWPELLEYVKSCNGPNNGGCFVSISSIYLRVQKRIAGSWTDVGLVEVKLPMGC